MGDDFLHRMPAFRRFLAKLKHRVIADHRKPALARILFPGEKPIPALLRLAVHGMIGGAVAETLEQRRLGGRISRHRGIAEIVVEGKNRGMGLHGFTSSLRPLAADAYRASITPWIIT